MIEWPENVQLIFAPNPILNEVCVLLRKEPVPQHIMLQMVSIMNERYGVGIAAPQVGLPYSFFIMQNQKGINYRLICDPVIVSYSDESNIGVEGCLSIPNLKLPVRRSDTIVVSHTEYLFDANGNISDPSIISCGSVCDFDARVYQHEYDHTQGVLYPSRYAELFIG